MNRWFKCLVVFLSVVAGASADAPADKKGPVVHEWGVFRVNSDVDFANAELRAEWDDLPGFFYGHIKGRVVPQQWGAFEIRKNPIIFFHAAEPVLARVKVGFPGGQAGVWYPATVKPSVFGFDKQPKTGSELEWNLGIKACPNGWQPKNRDNPAPSDKHWLNQVRRVKADDIYACFGESHTDVERDKFLYYDGIFPQGKWLKITVDKDNVSITSQVKTDVYDLTMVERRNDKVRVGRVGKLGAGKTIEKVAFTNVDASRFPVEGAELLVQQITSAGLFEDEARSLVDQWKKEMFEAPGLNLFYRLPQDEYDIRMPLTVTPKPESVVRVGFVFHAHLEPDFAERILELVKHLDSPRFQVRDAATKEIRQIGSAALVHLQRIRSQKGLSLEVRERIDSLIRKWSAREAFDDDAALPKK